MCRCKSYGGPITIEAFDIIGKVVIFKQELSYLHRWKRCMFNPGAGGVLIGLIGLCLFCPNLWCRWSVNVLGDVSVELTVI